MCSKEADLWCDWPTCTCKRRKDGPDPKPFTSNSNLKQHMKGHTREGLPQCRLCNKKFVHRKDADKCEERCKAKEGGQKRNGAQVRFCFVPALDRLLQAPSWTADLAHLQLTRCLLEAIR